MVNVKEIPLRSPFRYPGGKTWFVPFMRNWLTTRPTKPYYFIEPFTGGGIVGLTVGFEDLAWLTVMNELDPQVAAVWEVVLSPQLFEELVYLIGNFEMTPENVDKALSQPAHTKERIAFQTILKNRVNRGGILAPGTGRIKAGEDGKGLASRWYPQTLINRIRDIANIRHKFAFHQQDAFELMRTFNPPNSVWFIDPPYTAGGKSAGSRLYNFHEIDHDELFALCAGLQGEFLMTYDNAPEVKLLAQKYRFHCQEIAMKNTHHAQMTELVITR